MNDFSDKFLHSSQSSIKRRDCTCTVVGKWIRISVSVGFIEFNFDSFSMK